MFVNAKEIELLNRAFQLALQNNNAAIKEGEAMLAKLRGNQQYPFILLNYVSEYTNPLNRKMQAAIEIKQWLAQAFQTDIYLTNMDLYKRVMNNIVDVYLVADESIANFLRSAIITRECYFEFEVFQRIVQSLNPASLNGGPAHLFRLLRLLHGLFKNEDLEIDGMAQSMQQLQAFIFAIVAQSNSLPLIIQYQILKLLNKMYYYFMDYCDYKKFESSLFRLIAQVLQSNTQSTDENEQKLSFKCKAKALQLLTSLAFESYQGLDGQVKGFVNEVWAKYRTDKRYSKHCLQYFYQMLCSGMWRKLVKQGQNVDAMVQDLLQVVVANLPNGQAMLKVFKKQAKQFYDYYLSKQYVEEDDTLEYCGRILKKLIRDHKSIWQQVVMVGVQHADMANRSTMLNFLCESRSTYIHIDNSAGDLTGLRKAYKRKAKNYEISQDLVEKVYQVLVRPHFFELYAKATSPGRLTLTDQDFGDFLSEMRYVSYFADVLSKQDAGLCAMLFSKMAIKIPELTKVVYPYIKRVIVFHYMPAEDPAQNKGQTPTLVEPMSETTKNLFKQLINDANDNAFALDLEDFCFVGIIFGDRMCVAPFEFQKQLRASTANILQLAKIGHQCEVLETVLKVPEYYIQFFDIEESHCLPILNLIEKRIINSSTIMLYERYLTSDYCQNIKTAQALAQQMLDPNYWISNISEIHVLLPLFSMLLQHLNAPDRKGIEFALTIAFQHFESIMQANNKNNTQGLMHSVFNYEAHTKAIDAFKSMLDCIPEYIVQSNFADNTFLLLVEMLPWNPRDTTILLTKAAVVLQPVSITTRKIILNQLVQPKCSKYLGRPDCFQKLLQILFLSFEYFFQSVGQDGVPIAGQFDWGSWGGLLKITVQYSSNFREANTHINKQFKDYFLAFNQRYKPNIAELLGTKMQVKLTKVLTAEYC